MDFAQLLEKTLEGLGYELVGWERSGRNPLLRIFIDKPEGIGLDDCTQVSNHLSRVFAVEGIDYDRLEISSPGLDRLLSKEKDFVRFVGEQARIKLRMPVNGQRNFVGTLGKVEAGELELKVESGALIKVALSNIEKARLMPNI